MGLFNNFVQALKELATDDTKPEKPKSSDMPVKEKVEETPPPAVVLEEPVKVDIKPEEEPISLPRDDYPTYRSTLSSEKTIISKNTVINGEIKSFEEIDCFGKVSGNVSTTKSIKVLGDITGDVTAESVSMNNARIKGNIASESTLSADKDSYVIGDVKAQKSVIDGKIKGNINVAGHCEFLQNSVAMGTINASNLRVEFGARIKGYVNSDIPEGAEDELFDSMDK